MRTWVWSPVSEEKKAFTRLFWCTQVQTHMHMHVHAYTHRHTMVRIIFQSITTGICGVLLWHLFLFFSHLFLLVLIMFVVHNDYIHCGHWYMHLTCLTSFHCLALFPISNLKCISERCIILTEHTLAVLYSCGLPLLGKEDSLISESDWLGPTVFEFEP